MATGFSTRSGPDGYRLNFDTDNLDYYLLMQEIARHCIDGKPAADVAPVRHGRWIHPVPGDGENHCSVCHAEQPWFYGYGYYEPDYCPNCGARMDKEDEHEVS